MSEEKKKPKYIELIDKIIEILKEGNVDPEVIKKIENLK